MIDPINVEKTSDLTNVHSNFIFNKFNTSVSILLLLPFSRSRRVSLGAHWVDSRESSLLRRLERGREIGR